VDGVPVATQTVDLQPSQAREVRFPPYQFEVTTEPGRPTFAAAEVSIPHDRLAGDDVRTLVVPVVAALPVVFVDEYGANEDPQKNRYGETYRLRRLLAPVTSGEERARQLIQVRHVRMEELDRGLLADARLVVIAGVPDPQSAGPLLHEYVAQGGGLVIAAGGDFDPARWTDGAWDGGLGVLPAPLRPEPVGGLPVASSAGPQPFQLDFSSMVHDYFLLEQTPRDELQDLFRLPYFFKAVDADLSEPVLAEARRRLAGKIEQDRKRLVEVSRRLAELTRLEARGQLGQAEQQERARLEAEMQQIRPDWLLWSDPREAPAEQALPAAELAGQWMPRVLARYSNRVPFLIERKIGCGDVLLVTTGVFRGWNTLTQTNTVLIFDRIFRDMLQRTLPERNPSTVEPVVLPVTAEQRRARFTLTWPGGGKEALAVGALGADRYGLTVGPLPLRGEYRLTAYGSAEPAEAGQAAKLWEVPLAVNGPAVESELAALDSAGLETRMGKAEYRLIGQGQSIALAGAGARDQEFWRWLMTAALAGLLVELGLLVWPWRAGEQTP